MPNDLPTAPRPRDHCGAGPGALTRPLTGIRGAGQEDQPEFGRNLHHRPHSPARPSSTARGSSIGPVEASRRPRPQIADIAAELGVSPRHRDVIEEDIALGVRPAAGRRLVRRNRSRRWGRAFTTSSAEPAGSAVRPPETEIGPPPSASVLGEEVGPENRRGLRGALRWYEPGPSLVVTMGLPPAVVRVGRGTASAGSCSVQPNLPRGRRVRIGRSASRTPRRPASPAVLCSTGSSSADLEDPSRNRTDPELTSSGWSTSALVDGPHLGRPPGTTARTGRRPTWSTRSRRSRRTASTRWPHVGELDEHHIAELVLA